MDIVKFFLDVNYGDYSSRGASTLEMNILGDFLSSDVGFRGETFKEWALADKTDPNCRFGYSYGGNTTDLEEERGYIFFLDSISTHHIYTNLRMSRQQFIQLLNEWQDMVCKLKPKEFAVKHENGQFIFITNN